MKIISWNVNGLRAAIEKGFFDFLYKEKPDAMCLQETKVSEEQMPKELKDLDDYITIFHPAKRKGYSGTCTLLKNNPLSYKKGFGMQIY
jgi:exodeoxyribonuclease-3